MTWYELVEMDRRGFEITDNDGARTLEEAREMADNMIRSDKRRAYIVIVKHEEDDDGEGEMLETIYAPGMEGKE